MPARVTRMSTSPSPGSGTGELDELEHLGPAELLDLDRAHGGAATASRRSLPRRYERSPSSDPSPSTPSRPRSGSASACSAAPPCTSRWPRRSSTRCASSARSATTSARTSTASCATRGMVTDDVEHVAGGKTFFWAGEYERRPQLARDAATPSSTSSSTSSRSSREAARDADVLFLANIQPDLQREVREQCARRALRRAGLDEPVDRHRARRRSCGRSRRVDCLILNDAELEQLTDEPNLVRAAREVLELGPERRRRQAGRVRRGAVHARGLLRAARLPARDGRRPDRRRRHVRRRLRRLRRRAPATRTIDRRAAAPRDGLRHRAGLVQRRGVRHRARRSA